MIKEVDELLWKWGAWVDQREANGLGYKMSILNEAMAQAGTEHPERRGARQTFDNEKLLLVDQVLCRKIKADTKGLIDRYYRGRIGGVTAVQAVDLPRRRVGAVTAQFADSAGVSCRTVERWMHNAQVEFQLAMASVTHRVRQVGVVGVVCELEAIAANE
ncbi:hypothetical protein MY55_17365 [Chromobacterium subtsugae]|nr:hypothetical protein MY55_17365 [Chromobacterium subtsugae]